MNEFYCLGYNHKTCPVEIREKIAFSHGEMERALRDIRGLEGVRECFILSTCNRVELYVRGDIRSTDQLSKFIASYHGLDAETIAPYGYVYSDTKTVRHLFRVACSLDSMVVGENEIYGQLKDAFHTALSAGTVDSVLYQLAERALRVGKKARTKTKISRGAVSVSSAAVELAEKIFGKLSGEQVLVLGTGEVSEKTLESLVKEGAGKIFVASRNYERALSLAQKFGAEAVNFENWLRALKSSDIVISSTAAPHPVVKFEDVRRVMQERKNRPLFLIDIAVPRDIEASVQTLDDVYLYNIDDLESVIAANLRARKREIEKCEEIIEEEVLEFSAWIEQLELKPVIHWLSRHFDEILEAEIAKSKTQWNGREQALRDLFGRVRKKVFHRPFATLKSAAREGTLTRYLQLIRELFSDIPSTRHSAPAKHDGGSVLRRKSGNLTHPGHPERLRPYGPAGPEGSEGSDVHKTLSVKQRGETRPQSAVGTDLAKLGGGRSAQGDTSGVR